jgi:2-dehydro-3-deoxygluconokinase
MTTRTGACFGSTRAMKPACECRFDEVSLGEVMLRLDPGEGRIHTTRSFRVYEGGGEYNVARGLRRCFGQRAAIVTALADNLVGRLIEDLLLQGGVDLSYLRWVKFDGIGREVRNGLNFTERGFGPRATEADFAHAEQHAGRVPQLWFRYLDELNTLLRRKNS